MRRSPRRETTDERQAVEEAPQPERPEAWDDEPADEAADESDEDLRQPQVPPPAAAATGTTSLLSPAQTTLERYFHEIKRFALLSSEEEHELAVRFREHDDLEAAYRLITANLRLVVKIAMQYRQSQVQVLDLIQEGNLGLQEAVTRFDPYRGVKLSTYAAWWIRAYILKYLLDNWSLVRLGTTRAQKKLFFRLNREKKLLEQQGYAAGPKLLAERLKVREEDVVEMEQRLGSWEVSLDEPSHPGADLALVERLPTSHLGPEEQLAQQEFSDHVHENILRFRDTLKENERLILDRRYLAETPATLQELGDELGVTRERARQIAARLLDKLKAYLRDEMPGIEDDLS
ncbi:MAG: RNA polymerase factor sigma-32 [Candidatus Tectomicrobia bacterium]|nr:RNA polymerase factor sigma-32 [Candidatus Tectomicrobia bacterium]